jgi:hypothetical protein
MFGGAAVTCVYGDYYLDVAAVPTTTELSIIGRVGDGQQSNAAANDGAGSQVMKDLAKAAAEERAKAAQDQADAAAESKARAAASARGTVCVPDDLLAEWSNPPAGGKMEALKQQLKGSLIERATLGGYDQTKWMTIVASEYPNWNPKGKFIKVVVATDGGSCGTSRGSSPESLSIDGDAGKVQSFD